MFKPFRKKPEPQPVAEIDDDAEHPFSTMAASMKRGLTPAKRLANLQAKINASLPVVVQPEGVAMDSAQRGACNPWSTMPNSEPSALFSWYGQQGFIGHQMCAILAQHWFINKACYMPARDAIRHGFTVSVEDGDDDLVQKIEKANRRLKLSASLLEFLGQGRVFGVRVAIFMVESDDPDYYSLPFNPDSVTEGSYKGIVQVDPYWCMPLLDSEDASDPDSPHFYEPTYWMISGKKYHRSHLVVYRNGQVPDILKPSYLYGGYPIPQLIMERVYAAERTANEAPQLTMSKRLNVYKTDLAKLVATPDGGAAVFGQMSYMRDNYGQRVVDLKDEVEQLETSLADLDKTIEGQYVYACAGAGVPVVKMMGKTPGGMNATGKYDEASYHESLESIQTNDLDPLMEGHWVRLSRSEFGGIEINHSWQPLDSPTAKEYAEIEEIDARRDKYLAEAGAIDGMDIRNRLRSNPNSVYTDIDDSVPEPLEDAPLNAGMDAAPRSLYVQRKVLNVADLKAWAKKQGITLQDDLHVTVMYSPTPVDWILIESDWNQKEDGTLEIPAGGMRLVDRLGASNEAVVLHFASSNLCWRHESMKRVGAVSPWPEYQPHITLEWNTDTDVSKIEAYQGPIHLGPELFEEVREA